MTLIHMNSKVIDGSSNDTFNSDWIDELKANLKVESTFEYILKEIFEVYY